MCTNNAPVIKEQPKTVANNDQSTVSEISVNSHLEEDSLNSISQHNVLYDPLPSPRLHTVSLSFTGKKTTKFIWTTGHFRILCDVLEFAWGIIKNWKRFNV